MTKNVIVEMTEEELLVRTENYIKFQIAQANELLAPFAGSDKKICFAHLLDWKKKLQAELHELHKTTQKSRYTK